MMDCFTRRLFLLVMASVLLLPVAAGAGLVRVSVDSDGVQSNGMDLGEVAISADGRFVVFQTGGIYVPTDTGFVDIYLRDRDTDEDGVYDEPGAVWTELMSLNQDGHSANYHSYTPSISDNGRFVSFDSRATNMTDESVSGSYSQAFIFDRDWDGDGDFYEYGDFGDRVDRKLALASHRLSPSYFGGDRASRRSFVADNGRISYSSSSTNLVADDPNDSTQDIYFYDFDPDSDWQYWKSFSVPFNSRLSEAATPAWTGQPWGISRFSSISRDGRFVAYESDAEDLVDPEVCTDPIEVDDVCFNDVFVVDRDPDGDDVYYEPDDDPVTVQISRSPGGEPADGESRFPVISADGRFVTFTSDASNLVAGSPSGTHCYVHDRDVDGDAIFDEAGATETVLVSVSSAGVLGNDYCSYPSISANGRFVAFHSMATNLVPDDTNGYRDTFVHDRDADFNGIFDEPGAIATARINVSPDGSQANNHSEGRTDISADGRYIAFVTRAVRLLPEDTTQMPDVYVADNLLFDDSDGDGIDVVGESGPEGDDPTWDGNGDLKADSEQDYVASFYNAAGDAYVTVAVPQPDPEVELQLQGCESPDIPAPEAIPDHVEIPFGVFGFTIDGLEPGAAVTVQLYLPEGEELNGYWKYGRTHERSDPHWFEFTKEGDDIVGAEIDGALVTLHFVDGENGDADLAANGVIVDPGAPALVPEPSAALMAAAALASLAALSRRRGTLVA